MRLPTLPWFVECLREAARSRRIGASIRFGREALTRTIPTESVILVDYQRGEGVDAFSPLAENPNRQRLSDGKARQYIYRRALACEALIVAVSTLKGARRSDHVEACDALVNNFVALAYDEARAKSTRVQPASGGYIRPEAETDDAIATGYTEHGARYLLRFFLEVPVIGQPIPTATIGEAAPDLTIANTLTVPFNGTDWTTEV